MVNILASIADNPQSKSSKKNLKAHVTPSLSKAGNVCIEKYPIFK